MKNEGLHVQNKKNIQNIYASYLRCNIIWSPTSGIEELDSLLEIWVNSHLEALMNKERNKNRYTI